MVKEEKSKCNLMGRSYKGARPPSHENKGRMQNWEELQK